jgi:methyl-accepting chemotaxis protein
MKKLSPVFKTAFVLLLLSAIAIAIYISNALSHVEEKAYTDLADKLSSELEREEQFMERIGITNAILISDNKRIKQAIVDDDRDAAIDELQIIFDKFKKSTRIKDLKVHIHTADVRSYIRNWKLDKYGDDLSGFRKTVVKVKETRSPIFGFEVGRIGLTLRSIVPIIEDDKYLGSLEFIQAYDNVPKNFEKKGNHHLLLMNDSLLYIASYLKDAPSVNHYKLSSKFYNKDFFKAARRLGSVQLETLEKEGLVLTDHYMYTNKVIKDTSGNSVGMHLLGMPIKEVYKAIDTEKKSVWILAAISAFLWLLVLIVMIVLQRDKA